MTFSYFNPVRIHFGVNLIGALNEIARQKKKILLVTTKGTLRREPLITKTLSKNIAAIIDTITPNPRLQDLQGIAQNLAKARDFEAIVAIGGGSVIDSAKYLKAFYLGQKYGLLSLDSKPSILHSSFFESLKKHAHAAQNPALYAFPTTSGTSSELTKWATVWDFKANIKHSISDDLLYPQDAFYDPHLTLNLPRDISIHTALDSLSHAFESIWNKNANPLSTHYAIRAIDMILRDLPSLANALDSATLRENVMLASAYAGLAFSNTQTALAHAISYPLTMRFNIPHGLACSFSLPTLLEALPQNSPSYALLSPYKHALNGFFEELKISTNPRDYGLDQGLIDEIFNSLNSRAKNGVFDTNYVGKILISKARKPR